MPADQISRRELNRLWKNALARAWHEVRREQRAEASRNARLALKERMIDHLGGACVRCKRTLGDFGHVAAFDFHHRSWQTKSFTLSRAHTRPWSEVEQELEKCDLICATCHRILEATERDPGRRLGRPPRDSNGAEPGQESVEQLLARQAREHVARMCLRGMMLRSLRDDNAA